MVIWYIVSTILIVLGVIALVRGVYLLCRGALKKDVEDVAYAVARIVYAGLTVLLFWMIDLALGLDLGWIKVFVTEYATALKFIAGILFCAVGVPFIMTCVFFIKWFLFDPTKKASNNNPSSDDDKEREN